MLLGRRYAPITDAIGFLESGLPTVIVAEERWRRKLGGYEGREINGEFPTLLEALLPLTGPCIRHAWIGTKSGWSAYFDNGVNGSDPFPPVSYLATQIGCRGITIQCAAATIKRGAATEFSLYGSRQTEWLNQIRSIAAIEEAKGQWHWDAIGEVQPFEDMERYQKRRVSARLTPTMVEDYCKSFGIRPFDDSFYSNSAYFVTNRNIAGEIRTVSLSEARVSLGIE